MDRQKSYNGRRLTPLGWSLLAKLADEVFPGMRKSISATIYRDGAQWGIDSLEEFLANVNPDQSIVGITYEGGGMVEISTFGAMGWRIHKADRARIIAFERDADVIIEANKITPPESPPKPVVIFIGHGGSDDWRALKDHLVEKHGMKVVAYETGSRSGHAIRDVLEGMLGEATLAILVHTPEDETAAGSFNARPNVIHETGLFQGRLGFAKAIVLLKEPTTEFSNIAGTQQIRYTDIRQTFGDVLAWIKREEGVKASEMPQ